ncbi:MAG: RDD family protein [Beijerinckiaceae bacterium]
MQTSVPEFPIGLADKPRSDSSGVWASGELAPASLLSRTLAYVIDLIVVGSIAFVLTAGLVLLGFMSFGAGFFLIPPVCAATPAVYSGLTLSSSAQATLGMRLFGLHMRTVEGGRIDFLTGAGHALLFYVFGVTMTPLILLVGLFRRDHALLHDIVLRVRLVSRRYY